MGSFVLLQTSAVFQCLNICFAWKWFLSCVCPFMLLQTSAVFKCLITCFAQMVPLLYLLFHASSNSVSCNSLKCFLKTQHRVNVFPNLSPVWALLCFLKPQYCFNVFPHLCMLMASLLCGSFWASSNLNCVQMSYHMSCIVMALLLCKSLYASSNISCF